MYRPFFFSVWIDRFFLAPPGFRFTTTSVSALRYNKRVFSVFVVVTYDSILKESGTDIGFMWEKELANRHKSKKVHPADMI